MEILSLFFIDEPKKDINIIKETHTAFEFSLNYGKRSIIDIYYSKKYKAPTKVVYMVDGKASSANSINERPHFYSEKKIPKEYRSHNSDYVNSGFDKGHLAPHASFDYSEKILNLTYSLSNIIPQYPKVNKYTWIRAERLERALGKIQNIRVTNYVYYPWFPKKIGNNGISIPKSFGKKIEILNKDGEVSKKMCFLFKNEKNPDTSKKIFDYSVNCSKL